MTSPVHWDADGTPRSPLFDDVYRSRGFHGADRGLLQARHVFLQGCGLWSPAGSGRAWQGRRHWHVLETGFGLGLSFLATWQAWQQDPDRPDRLFFTSIEAWPVSAQDLLRSAAAWPELQPLAEELATAWRGLLPGVHRLVFEGSRVQLTLCIGPVDKMLRELDVAVDSVFLDGFSPERNPAMWSLHTLKAVARLCRPGTRVASWCVKRSVRDDLNRCGFAVTRADGLPPKVHRLEAVFEPSWTPRTRLRQPFWKADPATEHAPREDDSAAESSLWEAAPAAEPSLWEAAPAAESASQPDPSRAGARSCPQRTALTLDAVLSGSAAQWEAAPGAEPSLWEAAPAAESASQPGPSRAGARSCTQRTALVLGAGLSGSAVACSLARRGWAVTVLDAGSGVGAGASGLPAGLTVPHVSPDDNVLSRITRAGVRATLQRCAQLLKACQDWAPCGVLEHRVEGKRALPEGSAWPTQGHEWSTLATPVQIASVRLPDGAQALWHPMAAWLRPRQLVAAQLATPGVEVRWNCRVHALRRTANGWQALDATGQVLAQAGQVVVAGGYDTRALLAPLETAGSSGEAAPAAEAPHHSRAGARSHMASHAHKASPPPTALHPLKDPHPHTDPHPHMDPHPHTDPHARTAPLARTASRAHMARAHLPLNPLRGQISMGPLDALPSALKKQLPTVPVNGHGSFICGVPLPPEFGAQPGWYLGSTFERGCAEALLRDEDHAANQARLARLLPALGDPLQAAFSPGRVLGWAGIRCTLPDRLPAVGPLEPLHWPGLQVCTGMGARGISLSVLCGELIAAQLEGEPWPLSPDLSEKVKANRF